MRISHNLIPFAGSIEISGAWFGLLSKFETMPFGDTFLCYYLRIITKCLSIQLFWASVQCYRDCSYLPPHFRSTIASSKVPEAKENFTLTFVEMGGQTVNLIAEPAQVHPTKRICVMQLKCWRCELWPPKSPWSKQPSDIFKFAVIRTDFRPERTVFTCCCFPERDLPNRWLA